MPNTAPRPLSVKAAIFLFGILAFKSWLDVKNNNIESLEILLPLALAIPVNIAFLGLLSDAKFGRVLAVIFSALLAVLGISYWLILLFSNEATYFQLLLITMFLFLFYGGWQLMHLEKTLALTTQKYKTKSSSRANNSYESVPNNWFKSFASLTGTPVKRAPL